MILNLIADVEEAGVTGGMSLALLIGLIIGGSLLLAGWIFGVVLKSIENRKRARRKQARHEKKNSKAATPEVVAVEPVEDFSNLTEAEKNVVRKYRNLYK